MYNFNIFILLFFNYYGVLVFFFKCVLFSLIVVLDIESNGICFLYIIEFIDYWLVGIVKLLINVNVFFINDLV